MKVMIMAAGMGTRLGNNTNEKPKALIDINGKSILQLAVEKCASSGFNDIIINVHHFAGMVEAEAERLGSLGYRITVSDERGELLETGGGLYRARKFFDKSPFMVYNADIVTDLDLAALYSNHLENKSLATLSVRCRPGNRVLLVDHYGVLRGWYNRSTGERIITGNYEEDLSEIAFSGIHVIDPEIFAYMNEGVYSLTTLYLQLASAHKISTFRCDDGYWFDIGTPESLKKVRSYFSVR